MILLSYLGYQKSAGYLLATPALHDSTMLTACSFSFCIFSAIISVQTILLTKCKGMNSLQQKQKHIRMD